VNDCATKGRNYLQTPAVGGLAVQAEAFGWRVRVRSIPPFRKERGRVGYPGGATVCLRLFSNGNCYPVGFHNLIIRVVIDMPRELYFILSWRSDLKELMQISVLL